MNQHIYDLLVIGGGINGTGIAADAAGRGLSVALCEQYDLASGTSSASTKLIHGGLRYLEQGEFCLVHEALNEREVLMAKAPHLITPLTLILPYQPQLRPRWMLRLGLWVYDHLGRRVTLPKSRAVSFKDNPFGEPLKSSFTDGFMFSDCWVDDARLVLANALCAKEHGADIYTYCPVQGFETRHGIWEVQVPGHVLKAKALINATGPWLKHDAMHLQLVKGSHLIVRQTYPDTHAYLIQQPDQRVIFVIPYEQHFTLIGTTDVPYQGAPEKATLDETEKKYLLNAYNAYFKQTLTEADIVSHYSGVRPLMDQNTKNPSKASREYLLMLEHIDGAPLLSVFGGKITTYRTLAEHAMDKLSPSFPTMSGKWTKNACLPGGDMPEGYLGMMMDQYCYLSPDEVTRLVHLYGTRVEYMLQDCPFKTDLGEYFGGGCYEKELRYAINHEWVKKPEDFLYRRTKLYLALSAKEIERIVAWFHENKI